MRRILVVGAGQSGLNLATGLLTGGYDVTVLTTPSSAELRHRRRPSLVQFSPPRTLDGERELGLDTFAAEAPYIRGMRQPMYPPDSDPLVITGQLNAPAVTVDPRLKMSQWLEQFEDRGGKVVIHGTTVTDLDYFTRMYDLVLVAVGGGELGDLFRTNPDLDSGARPRVITQAIVEGFNEPEDAPGYAEAISSPHGCALFVPVLTAEGPAHTIQLIDEPGGPLDGMDLARESGRHGPAASRVVDWIVERITHHFPAYRDRLMHTSAVDANAANVIAHHPRVRHPVAELPSGGLVAGIGDVTVSVDPLSAQTWNVSTQGALTYRDRIINHGDQPFDRAWINDTFQQLWQREGVYCAQLSHMISGIWEQPMPEHFQEVIAAATHYPEVANAWVEGVNRPQSYREWLFDPTAARAFVDKAKARHAPDPS